MTHKSNGGLIGVSNIPTALVANGMWDLRQQALSKRAGNWPTANPDASISFLQTNVDTVDRTTYTFTAENFGVAHAARKIAVGIATRRTTAVACDIVSVTIGGVAATISKKTTDGTRNMTVIAIAAVPTGTTGDVVIVWNGACIYTGISVYRLLDVNPAAEDTDESVANPLTSTLTVSAGSVQIAMAQTIAVTTATWSGTNGLTEDADVTGDGTRFSSASRTSPAAVSATGTCTWATSTQPEYVSASFAKA